jgi:hypothetical protein
MYLRGEAITIAEASVMVAQVRSTKGGVHGIPSHKYIGIRYVHGNAWEQSTGVARHGGRDNEWLASVDDLCVVVPPGGFSQAPPLAKAYSHAQRSLLDGAAAKARWGVNEAWKGPLTKRTNALHST